MLAEYLSKLLLVAYSSQLVHSFMMPSGVQSSSSLSQRLCMGWHTWLSVYELYLL